MEPLNDNLATCRIAAYFYSGMQARVSPHLLPSYDTFTMMADEARKLVHHSLSEKGGEARKADALSLFIEKQVNIDLEVTEGEIIRSLPKRFRIDRGKSAGRQVHWVTNGKECSAPVSALKDRISRARARRKKFLALSASRGTGLAKVFQGLHLAMGEEDEGSSI